MIHFDNEDPRGCKVRRLRAQLKIKISAAFFVFISMFFCTTCRADFPKIPSNPEDLSVLIETSSSASLNWSVPTPPLYFTTPGAELDPHSTRTTPVTNLTSVIDERFSDLNNFIKELLKERHEDINRKLNGLDAKSTITNSVTKVSNLSLTVSALKEKFHSLSQENSQRREDLIKCRHEALDSGDDIIPN